MPPAICTFYKRYKAMTALRHHVSAAGTCFTQVQQRCAAMRPAVISVWNKTGAGNQN